MIAIAVVGPQPAPLSAQSLFPTTLTTYHSKILTAFLAILLSSALCRLLYTTNFILHFRLYWKAKIILDDQVSVIATNTDSPGTLLAMLLWLFCLRRYQATHSPTFRVVFGTAFIFYVLQILILLWPGIIMQSDPIPYSPGTCGRPVEDNNTIYAKYHSRYEEHLIQYTQCTDNGDVMACQGPTGQKFSWEISESEPSTCWFGSEHCYDGSTTITQRATIFPSDMGTLRESPMSLTAMTECSHLNSSAFIVRGQNVSFYNLGGYVGNPNLTLYVFDVEQYLVNIGYRVAYLSYNISDGSWIGPPEFLLDHLPVPYLMDNITAPSTMTIILNVLNVKASFPNTDPFFLTQTTPSNFYREPLYLPGQTVGILLCRERFQLRVKSQNPAQDRFLATGTLADLDQIWNDYRKRQPVGWEIVDLHVDYTLLTSAFIPSIMFRILTSLSGSILNAQKSVLTSGLQIEAQQNINTRREVTRWFGTAVLDALYGPYIYTSGTDNDFGLGITQFPDQMWFCDKTLRYNPSYNSIKIKSLLLALTVIALCMILSYTLPQFFWLLGKVNQIERSWKKYIGGPLIRFTLHSSMHLYRIALLEITGQDMEGTLSVLPIYKGKNDRDGGECPGYGVQTRKLYRLLRPGMDLEMENVDANQQDDREQRSREERPEDDRSNVGGVSATEIGASNPEIEDPEPSLHEINDGEVDSDNMAKMMRENDSPETEVDIEETFEQEEETAGSSVRPFIATMQVSAGKHDIDIEQIG